MAGGPTGSTEQSLPTTATLIMPETPQIIHTLHTRDERLWKTEISSILTARKVRKALEEALAQLVVLERDISQVW